jgi:hypothetical protein
MTTNLAKRLHRAVLRRTMKKSAAFRPPVGDTRHAGSVATSIAHLE